MRRHPIIDHSTLTGSIQPPIPITLMQKKVLRIKTANIRRSNFKQSFQGSIIHQAQSNNNQNGQSDIQKTNFWPIRPRVASYVKQRSIKSQKQSRSRPLSQNKRIRVLKGVSFHSQNILQSKQIPNQQSVAIVYQKQIQYFASLYQKLSNVLASIEKGFNQVQKSISQYSQQILASHLCFIDDFLVGKDQRIIKIIRTSRIYESLSIAYLFLQIAQQRMKNHQSYLINFIGYCLCNLLFTSRIYILKQAEPQFEESKFQKDLQKYQINSFGHQLTNIEDVLFRMQHNNQIITMMHRKLGKFNPKFQECIKVYLKFAERKKQTCAQSTHYIFQYLAMHIHQSQLFGISLTLQIAPTPYLPPTTKQYTLVFQPLGVIQKDGKLRPILIQFLQWATSYFEIVLWTWEMPMQVEEIVEKLNKYLQFKLYRYHCRFQNECYTKDLSKLGRKLQKTVIVDYDKRIFSGFEKNGIVSRWKGNIKDKGLLLLCQILKQMVISHSPVDQTLTVYAEQLFSIKGY